MENTTHDILREFFIRSENNQKKFNYFLGKDSKNTPDDKEELKDLYKEIISEFALPDMTRHGKYPQTSVQLENTKSFDYLSEKVIDLLLENHPFDNWHEEVCDELIRKNEDDCPLLTYGDFQKLVNMSLKYIYCLKDFPKKDFKSDVSNWHMPIDSYILSWISNHIYEQIGTTNLTKIKDNYQLSKYETKSKFDNNLKWSKLDKDTYKALQEIIKRVLQEENISDPPFIAEFYIWQEMKIEKANSEIKKYTREIEECRNLITDLTADLTKDEPINYFQKIIELIKD